MESLAHSKFTWDHKQMSIIQLEPLLSGHPLSNHPLLSGQLSKSRNFCKYNAVNETSATLFSVEFQISFRANSAQSLLPQPIWCSLLQEEIKVKYLCFILSTSFSSSSWYLSKNACNTGVAKWINCATYYKVTENIGHPLLDLPSFDRFSNTEKRLIKIWHSVEYVSQTTRCSEMC